MWSSYRFYTTNTTLVTVFLLPIGYTNRALIPSRLLLLIIHIITRQTLTSPSLSAEPITHTKQIRMLIPF